MASAHPTQWGPAVCVDRCGSRRSAHNKTADPAYTPPLQAAKIKSHPPVSEIYASQLVKEGVVSPDDVEAEAAERRAGLQETHKELRRKMEAGEYEDPTSTVLQTGELDRTKSPEVETAVGDT